MWAVEADKFIEELRDSDLFSFSVCAVPCLHSDLVQEALVSGPGDHLHAEVWRQVLELRVGAIWTASFHLPQGVTRGPTPTQCVLESYFAKLDQMQGTTPVFLS